MEIKVTSCDHAGLKKVMDTLDMTAAKHFRDQDQSIFDYLAGTETNQRGSRSLSAMSAHTVTSLLDDCEIL